MMSASSFLKKIQEKPESVRKTLFWVLIIGFGLFFFSLWLLLLKQRIGSIRQESLRGQFRLPELESQFKNLPSLELPELDQEQLKELEKIFQEEQKSQK